MFENQRSDGRAEPSAIGIVCTAFPSGGGTLHRRWRDSSPLLRTVSFAALLSFAAALGLSRWEDVHPVSVSGNKAQAPTRDEVAVAFAESSDRLLDPTPLSEPDAPKFEPAVSGGSNFWLAFIPPAARVETRGLADQARARPMASPTPNSIEIAASAPLPMPRQRNAKVARAHALPIHGIDVSRWQGKIDWASVRAAGTQFAFIKATEGGDHLDPRFSENWDGAAQAGVPRGAYHFMYWCRPAHEQAAWFRRNVPNDSNALPPVLDLEWNGHSRTCPMKLPRETALAHVKLMLNEMEAHTGKRPIIYTDITFHRDVLEGERPQTARCLILSSILLMSFSMLRASKTAFPKSNCLTSKVPPGTQSARTPKDCGGPAGYALVPRSTIFSGGQRLAAAA
jgi:GH25 family lysozyme M1 (1,4-beta-N-acetylmuramidase)